MIVFGGLKITTVNSIVTTRVGQASIALYMPMIWQRFNFSSGISTGGLYFDLAVITIVIISIKFGTTVDAR